MRKWIHAGMVAGGLLVPGAPPAQAGPAALADPLTVVTASRGPAARGPSTGGGLTVDGSMTRTVAPRESALSGSGALLGGLSGLGGLVPAGDPSQVRPAAGSGLPPGGVPVDSALVDPVDDQATGGTAHPGSPPVTRRPTPAVPRPTGGETRTFSPGGRPIAGEDEDFR